jgi:hypothetical protein
VLASRCDSCKTVGKHPPIPLHSWLAGLLIAEVNLNLVKPGRKDRLSSGSLQQGEQTGPISFGTMTTQTLGPTGNKVVNALYIFQSYSLLVACGCMHTFLNVQHG